ATSDRRPGNREKRNPRKNGTFHTEVTLRGKRSGQAEIGAQRAQRKGTQETPPIRRLAFPGSTRKPGEEKPKEERDVSHRGHPSREALRASRDRSAEGTEKRNPRDTANQEIGVPGIDQET